MNWWQAIIIGIVEGLTEYLPVSSTGHIILAQRALGIAASDAANAFAVCVQAGAIVAVIGLYWKRVKQMALAWLAAIGIGVKDAVGFRLGLNTIIAFVPAAIIGLLADDWIEAKLFGLWPIVVAWFVGGVAILAVAWRRKRTATPKDDVLADGEAAPVGERGKPLEGLTWQMALTIGLIQCLAMWPGTSRSLVTIVGGVLVGLSLVAAVEFSFILGVVTLLAATVYKALLDKVELTVDGQTHEQVMLFWMADQYGWLTLLLGSLAAWLSAVLAVKWMVSYLKRHGLSIFGYYRVGLAVVVAALILAKLLDAT